MSLFVHLYNKGSTPTGLEARTRVVPLANQGREGRTWLSHILRHYDDLAAWTYFAQGQPHQDPAEYRARLDVAYSDTTSLTRHYAEHFPAQWIKNQDEVEWHSGHEVRYGRAIYQGGRLPEQNEAWLRSVWAHFFTCPPPNPLSDWTYGYGAMYAVPRHRILGRSREFWLWCHETIARPEHQAEHTPGSGYAFEVVWRYLFGDAERYPVRVPDANPARQGMLADLCPFGSNGCGGGSIPKHCAHPERPDLVWKSTCLECPFKLDV